MAYFIVTVRLLFIVPILRFSDTIGELSHTLEWGGDVGHSLSGTSRLLIVCPYHLFSFLETEMQNPYTHRSTIRDPAMFFGRRQMLARIMPLLANTQSVSIIGERRIGKSSLLYGLSLPDIQTRVSPTNFSDFSFVYIDLQGSGHRDADQFLAYLLRELQRLDAEWKIALNPEYPIQEMFEEAVRQINEQGFKLIFLFDEFDYVVRNERLDASLFSFLRYMANNFEMAFVTASHKPLSELCHTEIVDSPFFNIFVQEILPPLLEKECRELISKPSAQTGYPLVERTDWILSMTGRQPMFIQIACFLLLTAMAYPQDDAAMDETQIEAQFQTEVQQHLAYTWEYLSDSVQQICVRSSLQESGSYDYYLLESRIFRQFVQEQTGLQVPKIALITSAVVKEALKYLWRFDALEKSPLLNLNVIQKRMEGQEVNNVQALRALLREAIGNLKQAANNDKQSQAWRYWFILEHSYVLGENNQTLAHQLNVAERTFYRERDEAVNALITVLQEIELGALSE
ncbi:MAG: ATP-binding protein [Chloroflexota bacterium]